MRWPLADVCFHRGLDNILTGFVTGSHDGLIGQVHFRFYSKQRRIEPPSNLCATVTLGKWQGYSYIQGDRYIQVNFAENIRELKILGCCPVTVIYRAVIYRFDCIYT